VRWDAIGTKRRFAGVQRIGRMQSGQLKRREFITLLGGAGAAAGDADDRLPPRAAPLGECSDDD
jgi:hypothetical protein